MIAATGRDFGPMLQAEREARARLREREQHAGCVSTCTAPRPGAFKTPIPDAHGQLQPSPDAAQATIQDGGSDEEEAGNRPDRRSYERSDRARQHSAGEAAAESKPRQRGPGEVHAQEAGAEQGKDGDEAALDDDALAAAVDPHMVHDKTKPMRAVNAVAPVGVMLVGMVGGIIASGASRYAESHLAGAAAPAPSLVDILSNAETTKVLISASLTANLVAMGLALAQRLLTVEECMEAWIAGMRSVTVGLMTLLFAWGVGNMSQVLHVGPFMAGAVGSAVPAWLLPTVVTLIAALVSVASGSSWGAMVLLFPTVLPLAMVASGDADGAGRERASQVLVGTIGGVISGSMFGDHVSPISDTTVLTSICTACPIVSLIRCQAWYCILVLGVSILAALLTAAVPESAGLLAYPLGVAALYASLLCLSSQPAAEMEEWGETGSGGEEGVEGGADGQGGRGRMAKALARGRGMRGGCGRGGSARGWEGRWWAQEGAEERSGLVHFPDGEGGDEESGSVRDVEIDPAHNASGVGAALALRQHSANDSFEAFAKGQGAGAGRDADGIGRGPARVAEGAAKHAASAGGRREQGGLEMAPLGS